jgi:HSP20 family protein
MNLVRWDPIREMDQFFARPLGSFMGRWPGLAADTDAGESTWTPTLDVSETDSEYLVRADLPAVKKEDVSVTVDNDAVTIAAERKFDKEEKSERVHRRERFRGMFSRSLFATRQRRCEWHSRRKQGRSFDGTYPEDEERTVQGNRDQSSVTQESGRPLVRLGPKTTGSSHRRLRWSW